MDEFKCPFNQPLRSEQFGCMHAVAITRREGPDVCCTSDKASSRCAELFRRLKESALPAFGVTDDLEQMPHSVVVKIQFAGLLSLQRQLGLSATAADRVEDIDVLVEGAVATLGSLNELPYADLAGDIASFKVKRRRGR